MYVLSRYYSIVWTIFPPCIRHCHLSFPVFKYIGFVHFQPTWCSSCPLLHYTNLAPVATLPVVQHVIPPPSSVLVHFVPRSRPDNAVSPKSHHPTLALLLAHVVYLGVWAACTPPLYICCIKCINLLMYVLSRYYSIVFPPCIRHCHLSFPVKIYWLCPFSTYLVF